MHEILLNDEDMSLMYLTDAARNGGVARDPEDHQAIEMLFENYLLQARPSRVVGRSDLEKRIRSS